MRKLGDPRVDGVRQWQDQRSAGVPYIIAPYEFVLAFVRRSTRRQKREARHRECWLDKY